MIDRHPGSDHTLRITVSGSSTDDTRAALFAGGGEMGARMLAFDWSQHPLGPPEQWPHSLRVVVRILLTSRFAMWLGWGPQLYFFYNDAYRPTLGIKDEWALGAPAREVWAEIWPDIRPRIESVLGTGKATWDEALRLILRRSGAPEETYHTFSYSPAPADDGSTGGLFCVVTEETERVIGERRLGFLRQLASEFSHRPHEEDLLGAVEREFTAHPEDVPFALVYFFSDDGETAHLACRAGIAANHFLAAPSLRVDDPQAVWPLRQLLEQHQPIHVRDIDRKLAGPLPRGRWDRSPRDVKLVPLVVRGNAQPAGVLIAALNPYRPVDEEYRGFIRLLGGQISAALSNARAYAAERELARFRLDAAERVRLSEERLRGTMEAARLGTWDFDCRSGKLALDARSKQLGGLPPDTAEDLALALQAVHPGDRERMRRQVREALQAGAQPSSFDIEFRTLGVSDGGVERWLRMSGRATFERGEPVRIMGTLLDISEIVKARETLAERRIELERQVAERTAKLQETIAELEGFSYSISHDLRAPLRAMQSFAQLLSDECAAQLNDEGRDYVRRIIAGSGRMDRLIHDVLVYSRVAQTELPLGPVDLQALLDGIVESYPQFQPAVADVRVARGLPKVRGNEAALTQCLSNLVGNAVKFVRPGQRPQVEITAQRENGWVKLFIQDNGIGIAPEMHGRIFGIFERLSRSYEGTGIGLAVVRKAAERMGGRVTLKSELGRGSTFCLELPEAT